MEIATVMASINAINGLPDYEEPIRRWGLKNASWIKSCSHAGRSKIREAYSFKLEHAAPGEPPEKERAGEQDDHLRPVQLR